MMPAHKVVGISVVLVLGHVIAADAAPCPRGSREVRKQCVAITVPEHGELDYLGTDWKCVRGYRKQGQRCIAVQVPENGELTYLGDDWKCRRGFRKAAAKCVAIQIPENGELDYLGNEWRCSRGFRKSKSACVKIDVPENAELDFVGNDWVCSRGFKKAGSKCVVMSAKEKQAQDRLIDAAMARARRLNTGGCEIDGKSAEGERAEVIATRSGCSYFLADGPGGVYLLEWYGGYSPSPGDIVIGGIKSYGFEDVCYVGKREGRVYVDDYLLSESSAREKLMEKCR